MLIVSIADEFEHQLLEAELLELFATSRFAALAAASAAIGRAMRPDRHSSSRLFYSGCPAHSTQDTSLRLRLFDWRWQVGPIDR